MVYCHPKTLPNSRDITRTRHIIFPIRTKLQCSAEWSIKTSVHDRFPYQYQEENKYRRHRKRTRSRTDRRVLWIPRRMTECPPKCAQRRLVWCTKRVLRIREKYTLRCATNRLFSKFRGWRRISAVSGSKSLVHSQIFARKPGYNKQRNWNIP